MNLISRIKNNTFFSAINSIYRNYFMATRRKFGYIHPTAFYRQPFFVRGLENVSLGENVHILGGATILTTQAKFVMKKNSGAAEGLTVVTGNHLSLVGRWWLDITDEDKKGRNLDRDVVVEEDVLLSMNVTLLAGVKVGRGAVVGAGAVCTKSIPPYAVVMGNPAKVISFRFKPEEIIEHEKALYPEEERIPLAKLERNYKKYFVDRIEEIADITKL